MKVEINRHKYLNKRELRTIDESGEAVIRDEKEIEAQNKIKEVCLRCTKKKCTGSEECFEKERTRND